MSSILAKILASKPAEVAARQRLCSLAEQRVRAAQQPPARNLAQALQRAPEQSMRFLCEFKRASPSAGAIAKGALPEEVLPLYQSAGAAAVSILTDECYFDGSLAFLSRAKACTSLPILRKDFLLGEYEIVEARAEGADAVLLIVSALSQTQLAEMLHCTHELGMQALVEVHDEAEAERALLVDANIIGVNHRNLATLEVDLTLTQRLAPMLSSRILVGESGIRSAEHVQTLQGYGAHALLVGETLMRADDPAHALRTLQGKHDHAN